MPLLPKVVSGLPLELYLATIMPMFAPSPTITIFPSDCNAILFPIVVSEPSGLEKTFPSVPKVGSKVVKAEAIDELIARTIINKPKNRLTAVTNVE